MLSTRNLVPPLTFDFQIPIGVLPENATEETTLCAEREGYEEPEPESQRSSSQVSLTLFQ